MLELIVIAGFVVLVYQQRRHSTRIALLERALAELGASRPEPVAAPRTEALDDAEEVSTFDEPVVGPWAAAPLGEPEPEPKIAREPEPAPRPDFETAIGTRWAVWVGGLALALGGVFLVRYSIEAGLFGPGVRVTAAIVFALLLAAAGEVARRRGFAPDLAGAAANHIPAILTAAGAFTFFGAIFAAHALYGFIGALPAFLLLGAAGAATLGLSLLHGQAVAGLGLLGAYATPTLVASEAPSAWTLFVYLGVVMVFATLIAAHRRWALLMRGVVLGAGLWSLAYLVYTGSPVVLPLALFQVALMLAIGLVWLRGGEAIMGRFGARGTVMAAVFALLVVLPLALAVEPSDMPGVAAAALILAAMLAVASWRPGALPLLHGAGLAATIIQLSVLLAGRILFSASELSILVDGTWLPPESVAGFRSGVAVALLFLALGAFMAHRLTADSVIRAASFAAWAGIVPLVTLTAAWLSYADLDVDPAYALAAMLLCVALAAVGEVVARAGRPAGEGGLAVSLLFLGSAAALVLALTFALPPYATTLALALAMGATALLTRLLRYPVIGWISAAFAAVIAVRIAIDPALVGAAPLSATPVLNALTPAYLLAAAMAAFAAWQLSRTTAGRAMLVMQAFAVLFAMVGAGMVVRHAMHGGLVADAAPSLAEQAIYTLIAIGAGGVLIALDNRSPSPVFRWGSIAVGVLSLLSIVVQHLVALNPLLTDESLGAWLVFDLLLLAYLLPALMLSGLAWAARGRRPRWYVAMLAAGAGLLGFAYVTLLVRRLFQGEHIAQWRGFGSLETYTYSAAWLACGVALLGLGFALSSRTMRLASALLVVAAVLKAFLFDMSELEGVLRALSFIGLGAVLIGIGLAYQRILARRSTPPAVASAPG